MGHALRKTLEVREASMLSSVGDQVQMTHFCWRVRVGVGVCEGRRG
jgi:hypothetical protein